MEEWADFAVVSVKYNSLRTAIVELVVMPDTGEGFGARYAVARTDVVAAIEHERTFITVRELGGNRYARGEDVRVFAIHGERFLRSDRNAVRSDNLGSLPEH